MTFTDLQALVATLARDPRVDANTEVALELCATSLRRNGCSTVDDADLAADADLVDARITSIPRRVLLRG